MVISSGSEKSVTRTDRSVGMLYTAPMIPSTIPLMPNPLPGNFGPRVNNDLRLLRDMICGLSGSITRYGLADRIAADGT